MTKKISLDHELCFQLYVASKEIIRLYKPYLDKFSLTYTSFITVRTIENGMNVSNLGDQLFLDSGTLSPLLKKLEGRGLINRIRSKEDERVLLVYLTDEGQELQRQLPEISKKVFSSMYKKNSLIPFEELIENLHQLTSIF